MLDSKWLTGREVCTVTAYMSDSLTSFVTMEGGGIEGTHSIGVDDPRSRVVRVYGTGTGVPGFMTPVDAEERLESYREHSSQYTVREGVELELFFIRTHEDTEKQWLLPTEGNIYDREYEGRIVVDRSPSGDSEFEVCHLVTKFEQDGSRKFVVPYGTRVPREVDGFGDEFGLGERFEPLEFLAGSSL